MTSELILKKRLTSKGVEFLLSSNITLKEIYNSLNKDLFITEYQFVKLSKRMKRKKQNEFI